MFKVVVHKNTFFNSLNSLYRIIQLQWKDKDSNTIQDSGVSAALVHQTLI